MCFRDHNYGPRTRPMGPSRDGARSASKRNRGPTAATCGFFRTVFLSYQLAGIMGKANEPMGAFVRASLAT